MKQQVILNKLNSDGALYRCQGIIDCIFERPTDALIIEKLKVLKNDDILILGRPNSSYALAALDILGVEKYTGKDSDVEELIIGLPSLNTEHQKSGK